MKCEGSAGSLLVESHWCYTSAIGEQSDNLVHRQTRLPTGYHKRPVSQRNHIPARRISFPPFEWSRSTCGSSSPFRRESPTHTNPRTPRAHGYMQVTTSPSPARHAQNGSPTARKAKRPHIRHSVDVRFACLNNTTFYKSQTSATS